MIVKESDLKLLLKAHHPQPHSVLGMHPYTHKGKKGVAVRALLDDAVSCEVVALDGGAEKRYPMTKCDRAGFFEVFIEDRDKPFKYRLRTEKHNGEIRQFFDPYCFLPTISEHDLYLFNEGNDHRVYDKQGAHPRKLGDVPGVSFAVWAPSAKSVSVVGDFNHWDGRFHQMRALGASGVWEIFIPGLQEGERYKYQIIDQDAFIHLKSDPYATYYEAPPGNASVVLEVDGTYEWEDTEWMRKRRETDWQTRPVSAYEVHLGSWKRKVDDGSRPLTYRELADELVDYVTGMGFTHVEFMPVAEYPFAGSWGYQVTGFFAPTHRFGEPDDFKYLVDKLHQNNIGVILDWVPAHFPKDIFALAKFDGTHLYEHSDPRQGEHMDWGTLIFNYGRHEVRGFLIASALAWLDRYHIDGLRVDAVASMLYLDYSREEGEWIPNVHGGNENLEAIGFLKNVNDLIHKYYPGAVTIAEESTSFPGVSRPTSDGGLGFDFKWNMGWMHDTLLYFQKDPLYRKWHQNNLTFGAVYQFSESFIQVFSHDEVVHGKASMLQKMCAAGISDKAQTLRALYGLMWAWPGKKTLFMGSEFGQSSEWRYDDSLDWHLLQYTDHSGIQRLVRDLNAFYAEQPGIHGRDNNHEGFEWVSYGDADSSVLAFIRKGEYKEDTFLVVGHYSNIDRHSYRLGVPYKGYWKEAVNTNSEFYGGSGLGNEGGRGTQDQAADHHQHSLLLTLPRNSTLVFKYEGPR